MKYFSLLKKTIPFLLVTFLFSCASERCIVLSGIDGIAAQENSDSYEIKFNLIC
jgi:hypothetical protein